MPVKAAASTDQGVLIVMDQFQNMILTSKGSEQVASIGPGLTWWDVYQWISSHDLMVVGGRYAPVGVPGLLLGGGISYFSGQFGWAANNVLGYEIVLGNGTILEVTSSSHPDLFWTLKGGSSNYGIVTRFDLRTFDLPTVYAGTLSIDTPYMPDFLDAIESWVEPNGGIETPAAAIVPNVFVFPSTGVVQGNCAIFYDGNHTGITNKSSAPAVLQNFTNIPTISTTAKQQSFVSYVEETLQYENRSFRNSFHATSFVAAPQVVRIMNETLVPAAISQLKDVADCYVSGNLQPVSTNWLRYAQAAGGDAISLDPSDGNVFAFNLFVQWSNPADDDTVTAFATEVLTAMDNATSAANLSYPFIYLNDAAGGEQIYQYYGKGKSLPKMRSISQDYDPNGVFQYLMPGGFKIGR
ncbi:MAG: hypothetical protein M1822_004715 [Bathelium mastoideum]|nr:MAG: hypothetical protein M1822_004715 [Bathelium mastoideum]